MAKLVTTKEKYGVSVATRLDSSIAQEIAERAERLDISFSKMIGMLVMKGFNPQERIVLENNEEIEKLKERIAELESSEEILEEVIELKSEMYKNTAAKFISRVAVDDEEKIRFIEIYNEVLNENHSNHE